VTEQEWLNATSPSKVMCLLLGKVSNRKAGLFNLVCTRDLAHLWSHPILERRVRLFETGLEGGASSESELLECSEIIGDLASESSNYAQDRFAQLSPVSHQIVTEAVTRYVAIALVDNIECALDDAVTWDWIPNLVHTTNPTTLGHLVDNTLYELYCRNLPLLRCIFGNPFRPVTLDRNWLTSTVTDLARGIYADRAFDRLPILADALQDAGCDNDDILTHCRGEGPHARGCWVVDLVLGKA
jgi:hypothetical protein